MALLDQKPAGFRIQIVADELEFRLGQTQSIDIVRFAAVGVGKQYLGRNLLHDAVRNVRTQRIRRALRAEDKKRSEEHTSELQSLMRSSYAVFCLKKKPK